MMIERGVFDTNILIHFSRNDPKAIEALRFCRERYISIVTWVEFLAGIPEEREDQARAFLDDIFEVIYPDERDYEMILGLRRGKTQKRLKLPDAMIYTAAKAVQGTLVTFDAKDFDEQAPDIYVPK